MRGLRWGLLAACLAGLRYTINIAFQVLDPIITTATVTHALGYMIYDMPSTMDSKADYHPQTARR